MPDPGVTLRLPSSTLQGLTIRPVTGIACARAPVQWSEAFVFGTESEACGAHSSTLNRPEEERY